MNVLASSELSDRASIEAGTGLHMKIYSKLVVFLVANKVPQTLIM